jgi:hypothetical protein
MRISVDLYGIYVVKCFHIVLVSKRSVISPLFDYRLLCVISHRGLCRAHFIKENGVCRCELDSYGSE